MKFFSCLLAILLATPGSIQFFHKQKVIATITDNRLIEASGLEESHLNHGYFWTHNDSGGDPALYLVDQSGAIKMEVMLEGIENRDWEEIITVKEGDSSYIYVAEIGDNKAVHDYVSLIKLNEPKLGNERICVNKEELTIMKFQFKEGARDSEAVFFDYASDEFVLITKREKNPLIYSFKFEESSKPLTIEAKGTLPAAMYTAADMNENGEILLKHYAAIYYWEASDIPAVDRILKWAPVSIEYSPEPQGEAICWYQGDFYTISEKNTGKPQEMLFFQRLK